MTYADFLHNRAHSRASGGFDPVYMPDAAFGFQQELIKWTVRQGRAAEFADCGLGKSLMELAWAQNVYLHTGRPVLLLTPLAVGPQMVAEGAKFGIECARSHDGSVTAPITVANYERLHYFTPDDFSGVVADESSILKNYDGKRKALITDFMRKREYRLLATATAAPNDYIELGTSSEALGILGHMDMLSRFFKNEQNTIKPVKYLHKGKLRSEIHERAKWRFKKHAEVPFWRWVTSWARALRKPSDLGFDDDGFILPELIERETVVKDTRPPDGELFTVPAIGLKEQRNERRRTTAERCEIAAEKVAHDDAAVVWCHLNDEGDLLEKIVPDAVQVSGSDSDERKEEVFGAFASGDIRVLVTKPRIGAFGLNWQHCAHMTIFPSHSYEQYYQGVRRCWRFGQTRPVVVDVITTEGELDVLKNLQRKAKQADEMFDHLVRFMNDSIQLQLDQETLRTEVPAWL